MARSKHINVITTLGTADLAEIFGVTDSAIRMRVARGQLPPPIQLPTSRMLRWKLADISRLLGISADDLIQVNVAEPSAKKLGRPRKRVLRERPAA
jgi:predicted DNA-binding transcriptional regulator AlpA